MLESGELDIEYEVEYRDAASAAGAADFLSEASSANTYTNFTSGSENNLNTSASVTNIGGVSTGSSFA